MAKRTGPTLIQQSRRVSPQVKAVQHQIEGRTLRPFLGLTDEDVTRITKRLDDGIRARARRSS